MNILVKKETQANKLAIMNTPSMQYCPLQPHGAPKPRF